MHVPDPDQFSAFNEVRVPPLFKVSAIAHRVGVSGEGEQFRSTFSVSVLSSPPWSFCNEIHTVLPR